MATMLHFALVVHIAGIVLLAGSTVMNYIISKHFWATLQIDQNKAIAINSATLNFEMVTRVGGVITILSGFLMVAILGKVVTSQTWFHFKMILVLLIIVNSLLFARPQNSRLKKLILSGSVNFGAYSDVKSKMNYYYLLQLIMILAIFVLSVFKF